MNRRCKGEIFEEGGESNVSVVLEGITGGRETEGERDIKIERGEREIEIHRENERDKQTQRGKGEYKEMHKQSEGETEIRGNLDN